MLIIQVVSYTFIIGLMMPRSSRTRTLNYSCSPASEFVTTCMLMELLAQYYFVCSLEFQISPALMLAITELLRPSTHVHLTLLHLQDANDYIRLLPSTISSALWTQSSVCQSRSVSLLPPPQCPSHPRNCGGCPDPGLCS